MSFSFKSQYTHEERKEMSRRIMNNYPDRVPVIVEKSPDSKTVPGIKKQKFLVSQDEILGRFIFEIRKHIPALSETTTIFLFINKNYLPPVATQMGPLYEKYKDKDGFLYILYSGENTFGWDELDDTLLIH